ncbi:hypothetical protein D047_0933 [Vibrio parahaemolyticus VPTS-2010_2]|nr:hypothetical protein D047_0933 [Vibrio parahaemolyticus VPTS-2010_2]
MKKPPRIEGGFVLWPYYHKHSTAAFWFGFSHQLSPIDFLIPTH